MTKKLVFITGWATGIWKACTEWFVQEGNDVAFNYLSNDESANELMSKYQNTKAIKWDLSKQEIVESTYDWIKEHFGRYPDILINNAWIVWRVKMPDMTWDHFAHVLDVNTVMPYRITREFYIRAWWNLEWKSVIFIGSMRWFAEWSSGWSIDYSASKAAIHNMVASMAKAMSPCRVVWIAPWFTKTPMHKWKEERLESEAQKSILKRYSDPEEIAESCIYLTWDNARWITGQVIRIDNWRSIMT